jgi:hypothetical protein
MNVVANTGGAALAAEKATTMQKLGVMFWAWAMMTVLAACGTSPAGPSGTTLSGDPLCVAAQLYINGEPCKSDVDAFPEKYTLDLEGCAGDDRVCANCIDLHKAAAGCLLTHDPCKAPCYKIRS